MTVLAIDTANASCQVGLWHDGRLTTADAAQPRAHADQVLPLVDALLEQRGLVLADVERFAFGRGPGGLTGVRVAASVVQGFAFALGRPVVAVSNLRALAFTAIARGLPEAHHRGVLVAHDAGMQQVCWCAYTVDGALPEPVHAERFESVDALSLPQGEWLCCGSAAARLPSDAVDVVTEENAAALVQHSAGAIARLAAGSDAVLLEPVEAQPVYWRHPVDG